MPQANPKGVGPLLLLGAEPTQIKMLKGQQWGSEGTRKTFQGAKWKFDERAAFVFSPPPEADLRDDLFPISGTYMPRGDLLQLQGEQIGQYGASSSVDGTLRRDGDAYVLNVVYMVASGSEKVAEVLQRLVPYSPEQLAGLTREINGLRVPAVYLISLEGSTEAGSFGPLKGRLKLTPPEPNDPNPLRVSISTNGENARGTIYWDSFIPKGYGQYDLNAAVMLEDSSLRFIVNGKGGGVGCAWFTNAAAPYDGLLIGARAKSGEALVGVEGERVSGRIRGSGISDVGQPTSYEARFEGRRYDD
jgi:hypothetical protein